MKYYLVYLEGEFYAYATNKKIVKKFLKIRPEKFTVLPIDSKKIPENLLEYQYEGSELVYFDGYNSIHECVMREFEQEMFVTELYMMVSDWLHCIARTKEMMKYIKFTEEEKDEINDSFKFINLIFEDHTQTEIDNRIDECIDIYKFLKWTHRH